VIYHTSASTIRNSQKGVEEVGGTLLANSQSIATGVHKDWYKTTNYKTFTRYRGTKKNVQNHELLDP